MTSSLTELRPPPTLPSAPPIRRNKPSTAWYWLAGVLAVLGLAAAVTWSAVGTLGALDRVDSFARVAIPGQVTVSVTDPGAKVVYYESAKQIARYADPVGTGRNATRWSRETVATTAVPYQGNATPSWQQLGLQVTGPDGAAVAVKASGSRAQYDVTPSRLGTAVATFQARTVGQYRVSATAGTQDGATLAVGDNLGKGIAAATLWAATLALLAVLGATVIAVAAHRGRSRVAG